MGTYIDRNTMRVNPITPFTYRDGLTFLEVLEQLRKRDVELCEEINQSLEETRKIINAAIAELLDEISGPIAEIEGFEKRMDERFASLRSGVYSEMDALESRLTKMVEESIVKKSVDVFSYHYGEVVPLQDNVFGDDNHYSNHGLTAGDYERRYYTAQEIEDNVWDVEHMAYRGLFTGRRGNPRVMYNDHDGTLQSVRAQIAAAMEAALTGTGTTDVEVQSLTDTVSDIPERKVA